MTGGIVMLAQGYETERSLFLAPFSHALTSQIARRAESDLRAMVGSRAATLATLVPTRRMYWRPVTRRPVTKDQGILARLLVEQRVL